MASKGASRGVEPDYAYLKLRCDPQTQEPITWKLIIDRAIAKFAGQLGLAIPIDIMYISSKNTHHNFSEAIIRCPAQNQQLVSTGVSGAISDEYSVKLVGSSSYLNMLL